MILLDTHVWVWWVQEDSRLPKACATALDNGAKDSVFISVISCWEVSMLHGKNRLHFEVPIGTWIRDALEHPAIAVAEFTTEIAIDAPQLPNLLHRDPADRILIATARKLNCDLITSDRKILDYPHVKTLKPEELASA